MLAAWAQIIPARSLPLSQLPTLSERRATAERLRSRRREAHGGLRNLSFDSAFSHCDGIDFRVERESC
jgi:hypothetical protein